MKTPNAKFSRTQNHTASLTNCLLACSLAFSARVHAVEDPPGCNFPIGQGNASESGINFDKPQAHVGDSVPVFARLGMVQNACRAIHATGSVWTASSSLMPLTNFLIDVTLDPGAPIFCPSLNVNCQPGPYLITITPAMIGAPVIHPFGITPGVLNSVRAVVIGQGTVMNLHDELMVEICSTGIGIVTPDIQVVQQIAYPPGTDCSWVGSNIDVTGYVTNSGDIRLTNVTAVADRPLLGFGLTDPAGFPLMQPMTLDPGQAILFKGSFAPTSQETCLGSGTNSITVRGTDITIIGGPRASVTNSTTLAFTICDYGNYTLSPANINLGDGPTTGSFSVAAAAGCLWSATPGETWIHTTSTGNGNGVVNYTVDANRSALPRSGTIAVGTSNFMITQAGCPCRYTLNSSNASHPAAQSSGSFGVTAPGGCDWSAVADQPWMHATSTGSGAGMVHYVVDGNASANPRSGTITVRGEIFHVSQAGAAGLDTEAPSVTFLAPSSGDIVKGQVELAVRLTDNVCLGRVEFYRLVGNPYVLVALGTNETCGTVITNKMVLDTTMLTNGSYRLACLTVDTSSNACLSHLEVTVGNCSGPPVLFPASTNHFSGGQHSGCFTVSNALKGCGWSVTTSQPWITTTESEGVTVAKVLYTVDSNGEPSPRAGVITVNGQDFTIYQGASTPPIIISLSGSLTFGCVAVGSSAQRTLTIASVSTSPLLVSHINYPAGFSGDWPSGIIPPGGSQNVTVTFSPTDSISYGGTVRVNGDQTGGANTLLASGTAYRIDAAPQLSALGVSNGLFRFRLSGGAECGYVIQVSSDFVNWLTLETNVIPAGGSVLISDPIIGAGARFYRAVGF